MTEQEIMVKLKPLIIILIVLIIIAEILLILSALMLQSFYLAASVIPLSALLIIALNLKSKIYGKTR